MVQRYETLSRRTIRLSPNSYPTAMVLVDGQDHHIIDYEKRIKWQNTIFAWFSKWLQDDDSWWNEMYGNEKM